MRFTENGQLELEEAEHEQMQQTPSPSRLHYQMTALDAALNHYFSPKKKSPSRPGTQRKLHFSPNQSDDEEIEGGEPARRKIQKYGQIQCDFAAIKHCFEDLDKNLVNKENEKLLFDEYPTMFRQWTSLLESGRFNILVHGLGSKRKLFDQFRHYLSDSHVFVFDGLCQGIQPLLTRIALQFQLKIRQPKVPLRELAAVLANGVDRVLGESGENLVIIAKNIDSPLLRPLALQEALAELAKATRIRLIASVDHVNAGLLWSPALRNQFNWLYFSVSTMHCYEQEVLTGSGKLLGLDGQHIQAHNMESLDTFWEATTANMRKILENLAIHAPLSSEKRKREALSIPKFCQILREDFATTSETTLRQQLIEFQDHNIILLDREEHIQLIVDRQLLSAFLDQKSAGST